MARRLLAFALAFVIIGVPLAGDMCEVVCAEHAGHPIDSTMSFSHHHGSAEVIGQPSHHHHADRAPAPQRARLAALPHACGHVEAIVSESRQPMRAPLAAAVVTVAGTRLLVRRLPTSHVDNRHGPPIPIRSKSPLRI